MIKDTELRLTFWRDGSTQAEHLAAAILKLAGYEEIDPQSPLGGPDGAKDILCRKGSYTWVAAVHFPTGPVRFSAIKKKFSSDLHGAPSGHKGFVFVTNQTLSPSERDTLTKLAQKDGREAEILHLQRLMNLLDSPSGYGVRLQYLSIAMSIEDQLSWFLDSDSQTSKALAQNTRELRALQASFERLKAMQSQIQTGQSQIFKTFGFSITTPDLISVSTFGKSDKLPPISSQLSLPMILLFHRLTCFDLPSRAVGQFRKGQAALMDTKGQLAPHLQPPPATDVESLLDALCSEWNSKYSRLVDMPSKLDSIAEFHAKFLSIHPFLDGNGRSGRAILMQQCLDLFGRADMSLMNKGGDYYTALQKADGGNRTPLAALIAPVVQD